MSFGTACKAALGLFSAETIYFTWTGHVSYADLSRLNALSNHRPKNTHSLHPKLKSHLRELPPVFSFPAPRVQPVQPFTPSRCSPPGVRECFCNESDVRGPARIRVRRLRYSESNLTAQFECPECSRQHSEPKLSKTFSPRVSHLTLPVIVLFPACLS